MSKESERERNETKEAGEKKTASYGATLDAGDDSRDEDGVGGVVGEFSDHGLNESGWLIRVREDVKRREREREKVKKRHRDRKG